MNDLFTRAWNHDLGEARLPLPRFRTTLPVHGMQEAAADSLLRSGLYRQIDQADLEMISAPIYALCCPLVPKGRESFICWVRGCGWQHMQPMHELLCRQQYKMLSQCLSIDATWRPYDRRLTAGRCNVKQSSKLIRNKLQEVYTMLFNIQ